MRDLQFTEQQLQYLQLCEDEFRERTGIKFSRSDEKGRPTLNFSFSKDGLIFYQLVQATAHYLLEEQNRFLLDLYYKEPLQLVEIAGIVQGIQGIADVAPWSTSSYSQQTSDEAIICLIRDLPADLALAFELPRYRKFIELCFPLDTKDENSFRRVVIQTSDRVMNLVKDSRTFKSYMNDEQREASPTNIAGMPPFMAGLHFTMLKEVEDFEDKLMIYIADTWQSPGLGQVIIHSDSESHSRRLFQQHGVNLVFAPSGSGKTTSIMNEFTREWGFYMVSSAFPRAIGRQQSRLGSNILDPKNYPGVSRDTFEIPKILRFCGGEPSVQLDHMRRAWGDILEARCRVFHAFCEAKQNSSEDFKPATWLSFQLNCGEWDPFLQIFRVLSLCSSEGLYQNPMSGQQADRARITASRALVRWICIDEAQEDVRYHIKGNKSLNMLRLAMHVITKTYKWDSAIFAGTSLNIHGAIEAVQWVDGGIYFESDSPELPASAKIVRDFPIIMDEDNAKVTLRAYGLSSARILDGAAKHGVPLWGRVKWTSMYAEKIAEKLEELGCSASGSISDDSYKKLDLYCLAGETYEDIVEHLIRRLGAIQQRGDGAKLLNKLLEAAISADIRGLPHVFQERRDLELVDHGFALVTTVLEEIWKMMSAYFEPISRDANHLTLALREGVSSEEGVVHLLGEVRKHSLSIQDCTIDELTLELAQEGFTIVDCIPLQWKGDTPKVITAKAGYARGTKWRANLTTKLAPDFDISRKGEKYLLSAKLKPGATMTPELIMKLKEYNYIITKTAIDTLTGLVKGGFTIKNPTLAAELKERVAIDAILRFYDTSLVKKLIESLVGVSSRTGLGHPAEYYLAVQLRQLFASSSLTGKRSKEWQSRRERALAGLSEATNNSIKIQSLSEATLLLGDQTVKRSPFPGHQTVKGSDEWRSWVYQFSQWLRAIEQGGRPCASFLLPHNDFGPDLIFALRRKDGSVILCSIQLKLGAGNPDAVNKSSISWACIGKALEMQDMQGEMQAKLNADRLELKDIQKALDKRSDIKTRIGDSPELVSVVETAEKQLLKAKAELMKSISDNNLPADAALLRNFKKLEELLNNSFWKGQDRLSLLVAAGSNIPDEMKDARPAHRCDGTYEYYGYISGAVIPDLFGTEFLDVLEVLKE